MRQGSLNIASSALRARQRDELLRQLDVVESAVAALVEGKLAPGQRDEAKRAAAVIAGDAARRGMPTASAHARQIELDLQRGSPSLARMHRLSELVLEIRRDFERQPESVAGGSGVGIPAADVLLVGGERLATADLERQLGSHGLRVVVARSPDDIALRLNGVIAVVDLTSSLAEEFMANLGERHDVVIGVAADAGLDARVAFLERGGRILLPADLAPHETAGAVLSMHERLREDTTHVLIVDDDPQLLEHTSGLLRAHDVKVTTLDHAGRFWQTLEARRPDVLLLDLDMPGADALKLCRALRADARWSQLPVLFLTARRDADSVRALFAAGGDDYVNKPVVEEELVQRIRNRLARMRLLRDLTDRDSLTGVVNRRKTAEELARLEQLAGQYRQPLVLAMLDVDHLKHVNDSHGHDAGDEVLRRLGRRLSSEFRGECVVGRWGGEEFLIGMYGTPRQVAVDRLRRLLDDWKRERFEDRSGSQFGASFTAGVAEMPVNASSLEELHSAADLALSRAKAAGRGRLESAPERGSGRAV
jgi:diguanylate cyclase (GGDEF)-like protein